MTAAGRPSTNIHTLKTGVEGMDCGACALKIENALKRLPGVTDINVNYGTETLDLNHDADRSSRQAIEDKIRSLGYTPRPLAGDEHELSQSSDQEDRAWWETRKGQLAIVSAGLLALAFTVAWVAPDFSFYAYLAAAVIGLVPIARRALAGAMSGTPFSIETLMSVAAAGAVAIGATEEAAVVIFLFAVGELLENVAAGRARAGIKALIGLVPRTAKVEQDGEVREVPVEQLRVDDVVDTQLFDGYFPHFAVLLDFGGARHQSD